MPHPPEPSYRFYNGASMDGTFLPGDRLLIIAARLDLLRPGDVIAFRTGEKELVHRVVARVSQGLVTRGDNNPRPDVGWVAEENLIGRVTRYERNGHWFWLPGGVLGNLVRVYLTTRRRLWTMIKSFGAHLYRLLRDSHLIGAVWRPNITQMSVTVDHEVIIKYIVHGQTVASWWPAKRRFICRKPYDLVLSPPDRS